MKSGQRIQRINISALFLSFMTACFLFGGEAVHADEEIEPPAELWGSKESNTFPFQKQYFNVLEWVPSESQDIAYYHIYRDGELLSAVSAEDELFYTDFAIDRKRLFYTYEVTAVSWDDAESDPITVVIR